MLQADLALMQHEQAGDVLGGKKFVEPRGTRFTRRKRLQRRAPRQRPWRRTLPRRVGGKQGLHDREALRLLGRAPGEDFRAARADGTYRSHARGVVGQRA